MVRKPNLIYHINFGLLFVTIIIIICHGICYNVYLQQFFSISYSEAKCTEKINLLQNKIINKNIYHYIRIYLHTIYRIT